jgi:hypothetical protein
VVAVECIPLMPLLMAATVVVAAVVAARLSLLRSHSEEREFPDKAATVEPEIWEMVLFLQTRAAAVVAVVPAVLVMRPAEAMPQPTTEAVEMELSIQFQALRSAMALAVAAAALVMVVPQRVAPAAAGAGRINRIALRRSQALQTEAAVAVALEVS